MAKRTRIQRDISNLRKMIRKRMEWMARGQRGCSVARGCGCPVDKALNLLDETERELFLIELEDIARPVPGESGSVSTERGGTIRIKDLLAEGNSKAGAEADAEIQPH